MAWPHLRRIALQTKLERSLLRAAAALDAAALDTALDAPGAGRGGAAGAADGRCGGMLTPDPTESSRLSQSQQAHLEFLSGHAASGPTASGAVPTVPAPL